MIEIVSLGKYYTVNGVKKYLFRGLSFSFKRGDFISITGPSGSGKTTLLKIISGIEKPSEGYVSFDGYVPSIPVVGDMLVSRFRRKYIGFVFQTFELLEGVSVLDNVLLSVYLGLGSVKKYKEKAKNILKYLGIQEYIDSDVRILSGGQKQRVSLARALIFEPRYILADEPTANLDEKTSLEIVSFLENISKDMNVGVLFVTHRKDVMDYSDFVIVIENSECKINYNTKKSLNNNKL